MTKKVKINWTRLRPTIILLLIASLGLGIILYQFTDNIVFYYTPTEAIEKNLKPQQIIRIGGFVKESSIRNNQTSMNFILTDYATEINIVYSGLLPNLFRENQGAVAKGHFENGLFVAEEILAKHDERYMPKDVVNKLKEEGKWRD